MEYCYSLRELLLSLKSNVSRMTDYIGQQYITLISNLLFLSIP